ncbi:hypothetical protein M413DRAFT_32183 [Hebeloma cylindrosporum]|uniref:Uncharacterized protein n=1 Tax=Hebeloma cylindrosporum TaxID=76867 RepID=A0A0C2Y426_HEBCY|nr:hypothetical protein M413DRAFT_32183 [Hebeloma cylindrosporum h7]
MSGKSLLDVVFIEIIDQIIDYLEDDKESFISCARTCRAFLHRAQLHIFRYVTIATRRLDDMEVSVLPTRRLEKLYDSVKNSPTLPRNIRILNFEISDDGAWLSRDLNLYFIMTLLDRSKERFLVLNNLEKVPIGVFLTCPRLLFLRVAHVSIDATKTFVAQEGQPQLETFEFYNCSQAVDDIFGLLIPSRPHLDPSHLRSLDVSPQTRNPIRSLPRLMAAVGSSLESLVIDDIECHPKLSTFFNLSQLPALKTIHTACAPYNVYRVHAFDGLSDLLRSSGQSTSLENLEVAMTIDPSPEFCIDASWWDAKHPGWARFDKALDHVTTLSRFTKLNVRIHFMKMGGNSLPSDGQEPTYWGVKWEAEKIQFPICHPRDIEQTALHLVATLLSRKDSLEDVIMHIHTTAMTRADYTRSLALVVKMMIDDLLWRNSDMDATLQDEIVDLAVATWIDYWNISLGCAPDGYEPSTETNFVDPFAISAFIGDLRCLGLLSFEVFETCVAFLLNRMQTPMHLRCLRLLFSHGGAYTRCGFNVPSLFKCQEVIKKRSAHFIRMHTVEEYLLHEVINDLINRELGSYYGQYWDERLDLEDALMGSVCVVGEFVDSTASRMTAGVGGGALGEQSKHGVAGYSCTPPNHRSLV